jgi:hypothetical protein
VFTGLEKVWVTVDKVGIPTFGLDRTGSARPTLAPAPEGSGILEETDMVGIMDFDNLQSGSSVSDTLPYEAISITGRDCFWDGSVPNPLVSVGSPTMYK